MTALDALLHALPWYCGQAEGLQFPGDTLAVTFGQKFSYLAFYIYSTLGHSRQEVVNVVSTMLKMNANLKCEYLAETSSSCCLASTSKCTQSTNEKTVTCGNFLIGFVGIDGLLPRNERQKGLLSVSEVHFLF